MVHLLGDLIKHACKENLSISTKDVTLRGRDNSVIKADIKFTFENTSKYVDVVVMDPANVAYRRLVDGSCERFGAAAMNREEAKKKHYSCVPDIVNNGRFVPFAVEATGRLGPAALTFVENLTRHQPGLRNRFVDQVGMVLAKYNSKCVDFMRLDLVDRAPHSWVSLP